MNKLREAAIALLKSAPDHIDGHWPELDEVVKALAQTEQEPVALESIEQYRMQMAAISTAAIGYWTEGDNIHPDYDTPALRGVAKLYAKYSELYVAPLSKFEQEPVAWKHDCAALLTNGIELWIDRCPHCGKPRPNPPSIRSKHE